MPEADDDAVHSSSPKTMRSRRLQRCATCGLNPALCVCASLPRLATRSEVVIVLHRKERFKSTDTGKLAAHMLARATCFARDGRTTPEVEDATFGSWVLFPGQGALPLHEAAARGVSRLIVPDGTWQQAARIARRDPLCAPLPRVRVDVARASAYRLRRNARPDGLCTLEAIAEALRVLEGDALADALLAAFTTWRERAEQLRAGAHAARPTHRACRDVP